MTDSTGAAATLTQTAQPTDGTATTQPASNAPWYGSFNDDLKGYVETKGWKGPEATVESYRNLEKLHGVPPEQIIKLPKDGAPPEEWNKVWDRLGRPADPKEYNIPEGADGDTTFAEWARGTFHELGIPKAMAEKLAAKYSEFGQSIMAKKQESYQATVAQETTALKQEWGAAYDQNINKAKAAVNGLGLDTESIDKLEQALGFAGVMKLLHNIGSKTGEGDFVTSGSGGNFGVLSPGAAISRIKMLKEDADFTKRYLSGNSAAVEEMQRLHKWAAGEA